ncbi:transposase [Sinorhizobium medicae]|uniref:transposase n=2 Tax=Sinorhizobium medicae TaxID=110321 RepID=UPI00399ACD33
MRRFRQGPKSDETAHRLMSVPGIGPLIATALEALTPSAKTFRSGRDFAAWIGLTPIQRACFVKSRTPISVSPGQRFR